MGTAGATEVVPDPFRLHSQQPEKCSNIKFYSGIGTQRSGGRFLKKRDESLPSGSTGPIRVADCVPGHRSEGIAESRPEFRGNHIV